jgi:hypothetical protein
MDQDSANLTKALDWLAARGIEALPGEAGVLRVAQRLKRLLMEALTMGGYDLVDGSGPLREGEARFINGHLELFFKKAIYPHNIFFKRADGAWGFALFPGKSGWAGVTLPFAQEFLIRQLGAVDALLVDNGGDVALMWRGHRIVGSSEGRQELRSIFLITVPKGHYGGDAAVLF